MSYFVRTIQISGKFTNFVQLLCRQCLYTNYKLLTIYFQDMKNYLKTPQVMSYLMETFASDRKFFSVRGCRSFHISPETRARV